MPRSGPQAICRAPLVGGEPSGREAGAAPGRKICFWRAVALRFTLQQIPSSWCGLNSRVARRSSVSPRTCRDDAPTAAATKARLILGFNQPVQCAVRLAFHCAEAILVVEILGKVGAQVVRQRCMLKWPFS